MAYEDEDEFTRPPGGSEWEDDPPREDRDDDWTGPDVYPPDPYTVQELGPLPRQGPAAPPQEWVQANTYQGFQPEPGLVTFFDETSNASPDRNLQNRQTGERTSPPSYLDARQPIPGTSGFARNLDGSFFRGVSTEGNPSDLAGLHRLRGGGFILPQDREAFARQQVQADAQQQLQEMTANMPLTQRDRMRMQELGNRLSRIGDLARDGTLPPQVALQHASLIQAELNQFRQREQAQEQQQRQQMLYVQEYQALQTAGIAGRARGRQLLTLINSGGLSNVPMAGGGEATLIANPDGSATQLRRDQEPEPEHIVDRRAREDREASEQRHDIDAAMNAALREAQAASEAGGTPVNVERRAQELLATRRRLRGSGSGSSTPSSGQGQQQSNLPPQDAMRAAREAAVAMEPVARAQMLHMVEEAERLYRIASVRTATEQERARYQELRQMINNLGRVARTAEAARTDEQPDPIVGQRQLTPQEFQATVTNRSREGWR